MRKLFLLLALMPSLGQAEVTPTPGPRDPQLQTVEYNPDEVVRLATAPGFVLVVEFSPDERIETMAMGTSNGWGIKSSNRGNLLFIKQDIGASDTNLSVITDARRYTFYLAPGFGSEQRPPYSVKFRYAGIDIAAEQIVTQPARTYRFSGSRQLKPVEMFDNNLATSIRWPRHAAIPAIYALDASGKEMIINGAMRGRYYVVDTVAARFRFRLGEHSVLATRRPAKKLR